MDTKVMRASAVLLLMLAALAPGTIGCNKKIPFPYTPPMNAKTVAGVPYDVLTEGDGHAAALGDRVELNVTAYDLDAGKPLGNLPQSVSFVVTGQGLPAILRGVRAEEQRRYWLDPELGHPIPPGWPRRRTGVEVMVNKVVPVSTDQAKLQQQEPAPKPAQAWDGMGFKSSILSEGNKAWENTGREKLLLALTLEPETEARAVATAEAPMLVAVQQIPAPATQFLETMRVGEKRRLQLSEIEAQLIPSFQGARVVDIELLAVLHEN